MSPHMRLDHEYEYVRGVWLMSMNTQKIQDQMYSHEYARIHLHALRARPRPDPRADAREDAPRSD